MNSNNVILNNALLKITRFKPLEIIGNIHINAINPVNINKISLLLTIVIGNKSIS